MVEVFRSGGVMMWPLLFIGVGLLAITFRSMARVRTGATPEEMERGLLSILFWGAMALVLGVLGTVVGLVQMGRVMSRFGALEPSTVWGGFAVTLVTLVFGLLLFVLAMSCWYGVRWVVLQRVHA